MKADVRMNGEAPQPRHLEDVAMGLQLREDGYSVASLSRLPRFVAWVVGWRRWLDHCGRHDGQ
jgi:hypothetical protein